MRQNPREEAIITAQKADNRLMRQVGVVIVERRSERIIGKVANTTNDAAYIVFRALQSVTNPRRLTFATIYIYGQYYDGISLDSSCPKDDDIEKLREAGLSKIVYSTKEGWGEINLLVTKDNPPLHKATEGQEGSDQ